MNLRYGVFSILRRSVGLLAYTIVFAALFSSASAQFRYRTFSQDSFAVKKAKAGKALGSNVCFLFINTTDSTVNGLHVKFNSAAVAFLDSGGFPALDMSGKSKILDASGRDVAPGDSVTLCATFAKKAPGTQANFWWWEKNGSVLGMRIGPLASVGDVRVYRQPNGGNVLEYLYKKIIRRPKGLVIGVEGTGDVAWIRYMKADRKYFPHIDAPRCFDFISSGTGREHPFLGELKNPKVKKHDNHLLGELHVLKLAILANDSGVTEPWDPLATAFGDLIYNDTANLGDPLNGKTIRGIAGLADSVLAFCGMFGPSLYAALDATIGRINADFDGGYSASSFTPLLVFGTRDLSTVYYLHSNPAILPGARRMFGAETPELPEEFSIRQNYPNPFNPTTTIEFTLAEDAVVTLKVFNLLGQEVAGLLSREALDEGEQSVEFNAGSLPSGVYFYRIAAYGTGDAGHQFQAIRRMVLLK